jgi:hypothetical protein
MLGSRSLDKILTSMRSLTYCSEPKVLFNLLDGKGLVALGVIDKIDLAETAYSDFLFYNVLLHPTKH